DVKAAMAGLLPPTINEVMLGRAEVRQPFNIPKIGTIAGSYVTEGAIKRNSHCRLIRDGIQVYEGKVGSLRRFKDDASEVKSGFECGIAIEGYNDVKEGDVIEAYELQEEAATL
ncbi:MAG: EF-Tu/IF-2/RF-3 family GTPase, partial [bacterium]